MGWLYRASEVRRGRKGAKICIIRERNKQQKGSEVNIEPNTKERGEAWMPLLKHLVSYSKHTDFVLIVVVVHNSRDEQPEVS
jgi:hypothetical protein